jgi:predicted DsbA family dithiol-disulfide isomerase
MAVTPIPVDVWSDISCPWCYVGHHRLHEAVAGEPDGGVEIRPRAFELLPDIPPEGMPIEEYYPRHYGSVEAMRDDLERVTDEAARSGLEVRFDRIARAPNTRVAHRLVVLARRAGRAHEALLALFGGHFRDGADVGDADAAIALVTAAAPDLDAGALRAALDAGEGEREVAAEEGVAARMGVTGVPFFLAGRSVAVSGANDVETFRQLIAAARQRVETEAGADPPAG